MEDDKVYDAGLGGECRCWCCRVVPASGLFTLFLGLWQAQPDSKRSLNPRRPPKKLQMEIDQRRSIRQQFFFFFFAPLLALRAFCTKKTAFEAHVKSHVRGSREGLAGGGWVGGGGVLAPRQKTRPGSGVTQQPPRRFNYASGRLFFLRRGRAGGGVHALAEPLMQAERRVLEPGEPCRRKLQIND